MAARETLLNTKIDGGCLCGACSYEAENNPINVLVCHCRRCQRATGAAFFPRILVPLAGVTISGPVTWFLAESGVRRGFCSLCGTTLFAERRDRGVIGLSAGSLDVPELFEPTAHVWTSAKQDWLALPDDITQHPFGPP